MNLFEYDGSIDVCYFHDQPFFGSVAGANRNVRPIVLLCELESFAWEAVSRRNGQRLDSAGTNWGHEHFSLQKIYELRCWKPCHGMKFQMLKQNHFWVLLPVSIFIQQYSTYDIQKASIFACLGSLWYYHPCHLGRFPPFSWLVKPHFLFVWSSFSEILRLNNIPRGFQWLPLLWVKSVMLGSVRR